MKGTSVLSAALLACCTVFSAGAQDAYPNRIVKVIVGFPPGSAADITARMVAPRLGDALGQAVIVENKAGASSNIAAEAVVRAPADGYTLMLGSAANAIGASLSKQTHVDFARELVPVAPLTSLPNLLVVHPSLPVHSVQELIAYAKSDEAQKNGILYGSTGTGTVPHLSGEMFNAMAGVKLVHIPYKGSPPAVADLLAGRVQVMFSPASTVLPYIKAGKLRALASTGSKRTPAAPELPTLAESGLPGYETSIWFGLFAPAGTPREIVERLSKEAARATASPELKAQFAAQAIDVMTGTPEQFAAYVRREIEKWARLVETSGAGVD
jgi:tripartite-type tricarboxylate transporter receptor subunit TctC